MSHGIDTHADTHLVNICSHAMAVPQRAQCFFKRYSQKLGRERENKREEMQSRATRKKMKKKKIKQQDEVDGWW